VLRGEPVGQLINDGAFPIIDEDAKPEDIPPLVDQYYDRSEHKVRLQRAKGEWKGETRVYKGVVMGLGRGCHT
jgi:hypothetical protein